MHFKMTPGDSRTFKRKQKQVMMLAIGVWVECQEGETQIHVVGSQNFHAIVVDKPASKRYHSALFRHLRQELLDNCCWVPPEEKTASEPQSCSSREPASLHTIHLEKYAGPLMMPPSSDGFEHIETNQATES